MSRVPEPVRKRLEEARRLQALAEEQWADKVPRKHPLPEWRKVLVKKGEHR